MFGPKNAARDVAATLIAGLTDGSLVLRPGAESAAKPDTEELLTKALDALERTAPIPNPEVVALRRKSFIELCDPVRGLTEDIDFNRNPSRVRPLDL